ncbi:hypothetical protein AB4Y42_20280 [Paraburkholderia sp. EG286B]|uniref:hypothetical protein n=1 Tax=Paraburkholderia sp. EG286B TaxID=3237011 RepID=UPI0034D32098
MSIVPDLIVVHEGVQLQCVVAEENEATKRKESSLQRIATAHGCSWAVRTRKQIRENSLLLDNLEHFRQAATVFVDDPLDSLRRDVEAVLTDKSSVSFNDLRRALAVPDKDSSLEAVLIRMQWAGRVHINLEEFRYDEAIVSRGALRTR